MDNLAHSLAGAALGATGLRRRTPLAVPTLIIGANLPDVDVVAYLFDSELSFRRGWTHGIAALIVLPIVLTLAVLAFDRWMRRHRDPEATPVVASEILLLSTIAVASHPLLDWLNSYGLRWLMPFDGTWFYGDALFIVDPWVWILLGLAVAWASRGGVRSARRATACACVYIALMLVASLGGRSIVSGGMAMRGVPVDEVMVGPVPLNPNVRDVVMRKGDRYLRGDLRWLPRPRLTVHDRIVRSNSTHPAAVAARRRPEVREFLVWSRYPFYRIERTSSGFRVIVDDMRYTEGDSASVFAVDVYVPVESMNSGNLQAMRTSETGEAGRS